MRIMDRFIAFQISFALAGLAQSFFAARGDIMNPLLATIWVVPALVLIGGWAWRTEYARDNRLAQGGIIVAATIIAGGIFFLVNKNQVNISFEVGQNIDLIKPEYRWVRIRAYNSDYKEATCRAYLTQVRDIDDDTPIVTDTHPLQAADLGDGDKFQPVLVGGKKSIGRTFDILKVSKNNQYMTIASYPNFEDLYPHTLFPKGDYEFDISVTGTNCNSSAEKLKVEYRGGVDISVAER